MARSRLRMARIAKVVDLVVVTLCLPFYAIIWPFLWYALVVAARRIRGQVCAHCGAAVAPLSGRDVGVAGIRIGPSGVISDRKPYYRIACPTCGEQLCFDIKYRPTACNFSDCLVPRSTAR